MNIKLVASALLAATALAACEPQDGPLERAAEDVEETIDGQDSLGENIDEAVDDLGDAANDAGDAIGDAAEDAADAMENAGEKMEEEVEQPQ